MDIKEIIFPIREEIKLFNKEFKSAIRSSVGIVDTIARYLLHQKGKQIRPILVLLSAKASGKISESTYRAATLVELLHTATLIHDDVVDNADVRRGLASINATWKNKIAVLMGDYLLSRGLLLSLVHNEYEFLQISSAAVKRMSEGELLQIQKSRQLDMDDSTYFRIISDKTASLISSCCEMGAASATDDKRVINHFKNFGEYLGMAFQIQDDVLDYEGKRATLGKPIGSDIRERKVTLPFIYALGNAPEREGRKTLRLLKNGKRGSRIDEVIEFTERHGGIDRARGKATEFVQKAKMELEDIPGSAAKDALLNLTRFVVERVN
ncbi:MAG TPA: polyprenyl synthetase family protein [Candidatus Acidoferrales bacterium]|nr:polyprenyl synthetase family protein [Candidatus Acidoferrales bacterium]